MVQRRDFLKTALGLGVGSLGSASAKTANDQVIVGIIGVGGRGRGLMSMVAGEQGAAVAALCDVNKQNLARAASVLEKQQKTRFKQVGEFQRVLEDKSIDAVVIATPHHWHCPLAIRALQAGKHVYVEKPASHVMSEGKLLVEAAQRHKRLVQHGTQMRSSPVTLAAKKVLDSGILGDVKLARAWSVEPRRYPNPVKDEPAPNHLDYKTWLGPAPQRPYNRNRVNVWRFYRDYGNGEIGDDGIHDIDLAVWGLGAKTLPVRISAIGARINVVGETEYPNHLTASFQYADGRQVLYETRNWAAYKMQGFDSGNVFYGTKGFMVFSRRGYFQTYLGAKEEKGPGMRGGNGNQEHVRNFLDSVRNDKSSIADAEVAHRSCALVHLGEIAYRTGRLLQFDPKTDTFPQDKEATAMLTKAYRSPWAFE